MEINYKGGQPMPENVKEALNYLRKVGVMTRPTWNNYFAKGNPHWKRDQLLSLIRKGVLNRHSCNHQKDTWVLSDWCIDQLRRLGLTSVRPVPPQLIEHDETVGTSLLILKRSGACQEWVSERELKMMNSKSFIVQRLGNETKYPDAVFKMIFEEKPWIVAIEYERTGKSTSRYRSILRQYGKLESVNQILYVTEDKSISKRIQSAMNQIGDKVLMGRIGYINAIEWKKDPMAACIYKTGKTTSFNQIFKLK